MLTGQAKTDYQREYMRKRRSNTKPVRPEVVRPKRLDLNVRPEGKAGRCATEAPVGPKPLSAVVPAELEAKIKRMAESIDRTLPVTPKPQSHNPMMVGYVPPEPTA